MRRSSAPGTPHVLVRPSSGPGTTDSAPPRFPPDQPPSTPSSARTPATSYLLSVLTPGVDRFGYFRALGLIQAGEIPFAALLPEQGRFDVHFLGPAAWQRARAAAPRSAEGTRRP
ncbi:hypothetical protein [Actinocorallia longicatena]|uniref:Uncharacterized protein n=1 Tax=Actinocorallia longicatena TaxID=111803 RepID=A0ABP6PWI7_9ACTN